MFCIPIPDYVTGSVFDLTPDMLTKHGIRLLLADLDNTLAPYEDPVPSPRLIAWKEAMESEGIHLFVLSNSRKKKRCPDFCNALGISYLCHAGKPRRKSYRAVLDELHLSAEEVLAVGDQVFTDVAGAAAVGIKTVLVKPIAFGNPLRAARYILESPFRLLSGKLKKRGRKE